MDRHAANKELERRERHRKAWIGIVVFSAAMFIGYALQSVSVPISWIVLLAGAAGLGYSGYMMARS